jgi:hypothetical protein
MANLRVAASAAIFQCKSCERKLSADAFYASNLSSCKECVKEKVKANRRENAEYYKSYDRMRYREHDHRKEAARKSAKSPAAKASQERYRDRVRDQPERKARIAVGNALRRGQLHRAAECFFCGAGERLQAHHPDYSKPFDVFWLCSTCHGKLHTVNGDFHRNKTTAE